MPDPTSEGLAPIDELGLADIRRARDQRANRIKWSWWLLGTGILFTVLLAVAGVIGSGLGIFAAASLTLVSGLFQVLSVIAAGGREVSEEFVRMQLVNGTRLSSRLNATREMVENAYKRGTNAEERRLTLGHVSTTFVHLQDYSEMSVRGWMEIRPDIILNNGHPRQSQEGGSTHE